MTLLLLYILASTLTSALLLGYYWIALRNRDCHAFNRFYLLTALVLSVVLPLVPIDWSPFQTHTYIAVNEFIFHASAKGARPAEQHPFISLSLLALPCLVSMALMSRFSARILFLCRLRRQFPVRRMEGYDLIETDDARAPFSFLDNLFWKTGCDIRDPLNQRILRHELAHILGRHTWDTLFAELLGCLFWMNPFFRLIRQELSMVHEFIADAAACEPGDPEGLARMLLRAYNQGAYLDPAHLNPARAFFHSPIKRRIAMITNVQASHQALARKALALPVLATAFLLFSCSKEALQQPKTINILVGKAQQDQMVLKLLPANLIRKFTKGQVDSVVMLQLNGVEVKAGGLQIKPQ